MRGRFAADNTATPVSIKRTRTALIADAFDAFDREYGAGESPVEASEEPAVKPPRRLVARGTRFTRS
jgi:hypothetical protein